MALTFSVITPSYNQGEFIERTIRSVLAQREVPLDYVVCDGGSTDDTLAILGRYGDRLRWVSEPDDGQADAVNKGLAMTDGDIIAWINSDDIYYPGALGRVAAVFAAQPEVAVVYGQAHWIDRDDRVLKAYPTEPWRYNRLRAACFLCQPAVFFRRSLVERYGGLDPTLRYCLDYELWLRYGQRVDFHFLPVTLAGSRLYATNKTLGQALAAHRETCQMLERRLGRTPHNWLLGSALVQAEQDSGISRYDRRQTYRFLRLLVLYSWRELLAHNPRSLVAVAPKMVLWLLLPDRAWFRREDILARI